VIDGVAYEPITPKLYRESGGSRSRSVIAIVILDEEGIAVVPDRVRIAA